VPMFDRCSRRPSDVIYLDLKHADIVWRRRRAHNTKVVSADRGDAQGFPYFDRVQEIRGRAEWYSRRDGCREPAGVARVLQPARDVEDAVARRSGEVNPFRQSTCSGSTPGYARPWVTIFSRERIRRTRRHRGRGLPVRRIPYVGSWEIHGFPRGALTRAARAGTVDRVIRGGFFGGRASAVQMSRTCTSGSSARTLTAAHGHRGERLHHPLLSYPERFPLYWSRRTACSARLPGAVRRGRRAIVCCGRAKAREPERPALPRDFPADPEGAEKARRRSSVSL